MQANSVFEHAVERDADWQRAVTREIVSVLAAREEHSLIASMVGWLTCAIVASLMGLGSVLVAALALRLVAIFATRIACTQLRRRLATGQRYGMAFRVAAAALASAGLSWAMLTWPLIAVQDRGAPELAMLALVTVGVALISSLVGVSIPVLLGFTGTFAAGVLLGSVVMTGAVDAPVCAAILLPLLAIVPLGLGSRRQALQAAEDAVDNRRLQEELWSSLHHAEFLSNHDPLTGLLNRRALFEGDNRPVAACGLIALDLDHFKAVNDRYGHAVGDEVLVRVAQVLRVCTDDDAPGPSRAGRVGGEEFLVLVDCADAGEVHAFAARLRDAVARAFPLDGLPDLRMTTSVGVGMWAPQTSFDHALSRADAALYEAKAQGRDRVVSTWEQARAA